MLASDSIRSKLLLVAINTSNNERFGQSCQVDYVSEHRP